MSRHVVKDSRIDWFQILADLNRLGVPVSSVSQQTQIPKSTILGWKQGAEPKHADGELLMDLWIGLTGNNRHQAPRT
ncbi:hypothetical protein [Stenotrophomonas sp. BIGb0135]|uniref:hypothetical protein n=1 Tax=Stenotrophomonas sp. BIGb0135 TaxID=2940620 RepID=UPI002167A83B|nr:hypothetical protein [Stenotrophomonas sp. BIGb0135]MCS4235058.1 hypothetical protein [Stenotrophomonas sp. BIGb0135]MCS4235113.1 hypothetical protein [Stenotrophomonas sp. BIGb0135]